MPDIGDQLRETRMRRRIDITEVEAATKIRAKYLRALENEEWDLLPGPTFVRTFLRTYAEYLGLDSRELLDDYRRRYDRPSGHELTPLRPNLGGRRDRGPRRPFFAPWMAAVLGVIALVVILYALGTWGSGDDDDPSPRPTPTATPRADATATPTPRAPTRVRLRVVATGLVSVCVEDARGRPVVDNVTFSGGQSSRTLRGRGFRASFGTAEAYMVVDGRRRQVSPDAPIGYDIRPGRAPRALPESRRPTCQ
jgi:hypothetical protein